MFLLSFVIIKYFISFSFFFHLLVIITYLQIVRIGIASQLNFTSLYIFDHKLAILMPYFLDYTESTIYSLLLNKNKYFIYKFWDIQKTSPHEIIDGAECWWYYTFTFKNFNNLIGNNYTPHNQSFF